MLGRMTVDQIKSEIRKGIKSSDEAARRMTQEEIARQALKNSHNSHKNSSTAISIQRRKAV
jgi:hypothetical protein